MSGNYSKKNGDRDSKRKNNHYKPVHPNHGTIDENGLSSYHQNKYHEQYNHQYYKTYAPVQNVPYNYMHTTMIDPYNSNVSYASPYYMDNQMPIHPAHTHDPLGMGHGPPPVPSYNLQYHHGNSPYQYQQSYQQMSGHHEQPSMAHLPTNNNTTATTANNNKVMPPPVDFFVCCDFEATCDESRDGKESEISRDEQEIIEFPWVVVNAHTLEITDQFRYYVKPRHTRITDFCNELTGIDQDMINNGTELADVVDKFQNFCKTNFLEENYSFCLVTHGLWDLQTQLRCEARRKGIELEPYMLRCYDLKDIFSNWKRSNNVNTARSTLEVMCEWLKVELHGRLHSGLDDSITIAKILTKMIKSTPSALISQPVDWCTMISKFIDNEGKTIRVDNMPITYTKEMLNEWMQSMNIDIEKVTPSWIVEMRNLRMTGNAYLIFEDHKNALKLLDTLPKPMNNRAVNYFGMNEGEYYHDHTIPFMEAGTGHIVKFSNVTFRGGLKAYFEFFCKRYGCLNIKSILVCLSKKIPYRPNGVYFVVFENYEDTLPFFNPPTITHNLSDETNTDDTGKNNVALEIMLGRVIRFELCSEELLELAKLDFDIQESIYTYKLIVPEQYIRFVIAHGYSNLRKIKDELGVNISYRKDLPEKGVFDVAGFSIKNVEIAKIRIENICKARIYDDKLRDSFHIQMESIDKVSW